MDDLAIRQADPLDLDFLYKTWLSSFRYYAHPGKECRNSIFFDNYRLVIDRLLAKDETKTLVACMASTPTVIFGYLVHEPNILHYCFVKGAFARLGIAKRLFNEAFGNPLEPITYTHRTISIEPILRAKDKQLVFNPFLLYKGID